MEATYNLRTENAGFHKVRDISNLEAVGNAFYKVQAAYNRAEKKSRERFHKIRTTCTVNAAKAGFGNVLATCNVK